MTYDEALTVTGMVLTTWPSSTEWGEDEMAAYANGLMRYEASVCVAAVAAAQQKLMYRPSVAELREFYDLERAKTRAATPIVEPEHPNAIPAWVKTKVAALRNNDFRVLPQQKPGYDSLQRAHPHYRTYVWPDQTPMPPEQEAVYAEQGAALTAKDIWNTLA